VTTVNLQQEKERRQTRVTLTNGIIIPRKFGGMPGIPGRMCIIGMPGNGICG